MQEAIVQDRLPLSEGRPEEVAREARADAMGSAEIRPPQRYQVAAGDRFEPIEPRGSIATLVVRAFTRWRW